MTTTQVTEAQSLPHRANAKTAIEVVKAMAAGELPRLLELWSPKFRFHSAQSAGPTISGTEWPDTHDPSSDRDTYIAAYTRAVDRIFRESEVEVMHVAADGDLVIPLVTIRALLRDGTPYANVYCFPMLFEDGKVVEMWEIHDTAYAFPRMRKQLMGGEG